MKVTLAFIAAIPAIIALPVPEPKNGRFCWVTTSCSQSINLAPPAFFGFRWGHTPKKLVKPAATTDGIVSFGVGDLNFGTEKLEVEAAADGPFDAFECQTNDGRFGCIFGGNDNVSPPSNFGLGGGWVTSKKSVESATTSANIVERAEGEDIDPASFQDAERFCTPTRLGWHCSPSITTHPQGSPLLNTNHAETETQDSPCKPNDVRAACGHVIERSEPTDRYELPLHHIGGSPSINTHPQGSPMLHPAGGSHPMIQNEDTKAAVEVAHPSSLLLLLPVTLSFQTAILLLLLRAILSSRTPASPSARLKAHSIPSLANQMTVASSVSSATAMASMATTSTWVVTK